MNPRLRHERNAFWLLLTSFLVVLLGALPLVTVRAAVQVPAIPPFELVDRNKDGFINRAEAAGVPGLAADFEKLDANRDGRLDRLEFARW